MEEGAGVEEAEGERRGKTKGDTGTSRRLHHDTPLSKPKHGERLDTGKAAFAGDKRKK